MVQLCLFFFPIDWNLGFAIYPILVGYVASPGHKLHLIFVCFFFFYFDFGDVFINSDGLKNMALTPTTTSGGVLT